MLQSITILTRDIELWNAELGPDLLSSDSSKLVAHRLIGAFEMRITDECSLSSSVAKTARVLIVFNLVSSSLSLQALNLWCFIRFFDTGERNGTYRLLHARSRG